GASRNGAHRCTGRVEVTLARLHLDLDLVQADRFACEVFEDDGVLVLVEITLRRTGALALPFAVLVDVDLEQRERIVAHPRPLYRFGEADEPIGGNDDALAALGLVGLPGVTKIPTESQLLRIRSLHTRNPESAYRPHLLELFQQRIRTLGEHRVDQP